MRMPRSLWGGCGGGEGGRAGGPGGGCWVTRPVQPVLSVLVESKLLGQLPGVAGRGGECTYTRSYDVLAGELKWLATCIRL